MAIINDRNNRKSRHDHKRMDHVADELFAIIQSFLSSNVTILHALAHYII